MMSTQWRKELSPGSWTEYLAQAKTLDTTSVNAATVKYFHSENMIIVVVGDMAKIEAPLRALQLGEYIVVKPEDLF